MASSTTLKLSMLFFFITTLFFAADSSSNCYNSIFSFGDSLADTGNLLHSGPSEFTAIAKFPYGETYFEQPTGRCSNGRLIIDFIAEAFGLPLLPPYLGEIEGLNFKQGVNFAVAGATALDSTFFEHQNINNLWTNSSLTVQLNWFKKLLPSLCSSQSECKDYLKHSLILVGEIGGNDYNYAFFQGNDIIKVRSYVPHVVQAISNAVQELMELGAVELVVPGNLPIGCSTVYLTVFQSSDSNVYDDNNGCIGYLNEFAEYHNEQLQQAIQRLREGYPHARIIYADYYNAAMRFFNSPDTYGFSKGVLSACCGTGGRYNFNMAATCGAPDVLSCKNPSLYANWDGIHLTEAAYQSIATGLITGAYTTPPIKLPHNCA